MELSDADQLILSRLDALQEQVAKTREDVAGLKAWAGGIGALTGFLTSLISLAFSHLLKGKASA